MTSHYMEEVQNLCDRILILDRGKIVKRGTTDELIRACDKENLEDAYLFYTRQEVE